jgi:hypothetical protein
MILDAAGIGRIADHGAAGIVGSMIHDAAGIGRSMIHDAGWAEAPPLMNRPTARSTCGCLRRRGDRWAPDRDVVPLRAIHHPEDVTSCQNSI